jgi:NhaP-type Na+/H+ and K+/H+ antiporter
VVSLAAALSIPLFISNAQPFPHRNLILFITFIVILVTLVLQGLTLPWLIKKVNVDDKFSPIPELKQEIIIQKKIAQRTIQHLEENYGEDWSKNEHLKNLHSRLNIDLKLFKQELNEEITIQENSLRHYQVIYLDLLEKQRKLLEEMNHQMEFDEELIRKYFTLIDIEEFKVREKLLQDTGGDQSN